MRKTPSGWRNRRYLINSCLLPLASCLSLSDAARSWEGSAVLGVPPMSNCRGFPHSLLHQDREYVHNSNINAI
ncbi:MAG: hypothetical protein F6J90_23790 [Moorea sp. SIOASIH]|uniref:hypothetical protein n=1 Tax=Moorena sp. SIOASIH TaxID=2607817 RepID=UPI0013BA81A6|nr:hypothetical protein [Moorena sp. SIOASIH]NEO39190.1 hypothetical protein [Moorena sp. SIOASIH]